LDIPAGEYFAPDVLKQEVVDFFFKLRTKQNFFPVTSDVIIPGVSAPKFMLRHDYVGGSTTSYCGKASLGSDETAAVWTISKIIVSADGTTTVTGATNVAWADRYTVTYL
jgi:hypothetical protein